MDDDLVALARSPGIQLGTKGGFGEQHQRVRIPLPRRRRIRVVAPLLVDPFTGRLERCQQDGASFGRQAAMDDDRTVIIVVHAQRSARVVPLGSFRLLFPINAPGAHDPFQLPGSCRAADPEQALLGLRGCDAGDRANLGVRELAAGERVGESWQGTERAGDANLLAGRSESDVCPVAEPVRAFAASAVI